MKHQNCSICFIKHIHVPIMHQKFKICYLFFCLLLLTLVNLEGKQTISCRQNFSFHSNFTRLKFFVVISCCSRSSYFIVQKVSISVYIFRLVSLHCKQIPLVFFLLLTKYVEIVSDIKINVCETVIEQTNFCSPNVTFGTTLLYKFPIKLRRYPARFNLQVLLCHGDCDPVVPYKWGQMTASILKSLLKNFEFKSYQGLMHTSSDEELRDIKQFVGKYLSNQ